MINNAVRCALGLILASQSAWADLNNPTYKKAKEAYVGDNCNVALPLLEKYESEDVAFLTAHPDKKDAIDKAIAYCKHTSGYSHCFGNARGKDPQFKKIPLKDRDLPSKPKLP